MKRFAFGLLVCVGCLIPAVAQSPASDWTAPKDAAEYLKAALPKYDYSTLGAWHFAAQYQLYDYAGAATTVGTFEYWTDGKGSERETWTEGVNSFTRWNAPENKHWELKQGDVDYGDRRVEALLLHPLPELKALDPESSQFMSEKVDIGKGASLDCKMVQPNRVRKPEEAEAKPRMGEFPTYCFELDKPMLRTFSGFGDDVVVFSQSVLMRKVYFPSELHVANQGNKRLDVKIAKVTRLSDEDGAALVPPSNAVAVQPPVTISSKVANGSVLHKEPPVYPEEAKRKRIMGDVMIAAVIGTDGVLKDLHVASAPNGLLADSALEAVSKWRYKPYMADGKPIEVATMITVKYRMSF